MLLIDYHDKFLTMAPNFSTCQIFFPDVCYNVKGIDLCNTVELVKTNKDKISQIDVLKILGSTKSCASLSRNLTEELKTWSLRFISTLFIPLNHNVSAHRFGHSTDNIWDYFLSEECWNNFEERIRFILLCKTLNVSGLETFEKHGPKCIPYFQWTSSKNQTKKLQCDFKKFMEKTNEYKPTPFDVLILVYNQDWWPFDSKKNKWIQEKTFRLGVFLIPTCDYKRKKVQIYTFRKIIYIKQTNNNDNNKNVNMTSLRFLNERCNLGHVILI